MNNVLTIIQQYFMNVRGGRDDDSKPKLKARALKKLAEKNMQIES
jgi:membrane protein insertase Oxa1/YidC/SpoIIIJ